MVKEKEGKKGKKTETKDTKPKASPKLAPKASPKLSPKASPKLAPKDPKTKTKKRKAEETEGAKPKKEKKTTDQEGTEKKDGSLGVCNVSDIKEISDASQKALLSKNITTFPGGTILEPRVIGQNHSGKANPVYTVGHYLSLSMYILLYRITHYDRVCQWTMGPVDSADSVLFPNSARVES